MDELQGGQLWRETENSPCFDSNRVNQKVAQYHALRKSGDVAGLMFHLRSELRRDHWGLCSNEMWQHAYGGTKLCVERYLQTVVESLLFISESHMVQNLALPALQPASASATTPAAPPVAASVAAPAPLSPNKLCPLLTFFHETRHSFGRSALLLSGGAAHGFYHAGMSECR